MTDQGLVGWNGIDPRNNGDHKKWSLERYSEHPVTTTCSLRKSHHKDKSVTKWSQSATTRNVVFNLSDHNNVVTNNNHNNVVTDNDHICGHK